MACFLSTLWFSAINFRTILHYQHNIPLYCVVIAVGIIHFAYAYTRHRIIKKLVVSYEGSLHRWLWHKRCFNDFKHSIDSGIIMWLVHWLNCVWEKSSNERSFNNLCSESVGLPYSKITLNVVAVVAWIRLALSQFVFLWHSVLRRSHIFVQS